MMGIAISTVLPFFKSVNDCVSESRGGRSSPRISKTLIVAALTIYFPLRALGTTYFIDSTLGNDGWPGKLAAPKGRDGPWRTLRPLLTVTLSPGDIIALQCNSTWHTPLSFRGTGRVGAPIVVHGYGNKCTNSTPPVVDLAKIVSNWALLGHGIYSAPLRFHVFHVYINGKYLPQTRYPAAGWRLAEGGITSQSQGHGSVGLIDTTLDLAGKHIEHVVLHVRTTNWYIDKLPVSGYLNGQLLLAGRTRYSVRNRAGYYLTGARWMLETSAGWYQSESTGRLYVRLPDNSNPNDRNITASRYATGIIVRDQSDIEFNGIRIEHAGEDGVLADNSRRIALQNVFVLDSGRDGIAYTHSTGSIKHSTIRDSGRDGILLDDSDGIVVIGNMVTASGTIGSPKTSLAAIDATNSNGDLIERNVVDGAGYIGIRFNRGTRVVNNVVRNTCIVLDDCGAIYTWNYVDPRPLHSQVVGNIVQHVVGGRGGSPETYTLTAGIYLDDLTNNAIVARNTIIDAGLGIYLHNAYADTVRDNTVFDFRDFGIELGMNNAREITGGNTPATVTDNVLVSESGKPFLNYLNTSDTLFKDKVDANWYLGLPDVKPLLVRWISRLSTPSTAPALARLRAKYAVDIKGHLTAIGTAQPILLFNDTVYSQSVNCPGSSATACTRATNSRGARLQWPVPLTPFSSLVVVWPSSSTRAAVITRPESRMSSVVCFPNNGNLPRNPVGSTSASPDSRPAHRLLLLRHACSPKSVQDPLQQSLSPLPYLHDSSDCYRLTRRLPGRVFTHWKTVSSHGGLHKTGQ